MNSITVGILSDTHGYLDPRVTAVITHCDYIVHAGDVGHPAILEELKSHCKVIAVRGNNDFDGSLISLNSNEQLELPGGLLVIEHGHRLGHHPDHTELRQAHAEARLIIYGHTHKRNIDQTSEPWVINPGAAGKVRTHGGPSCVILTASETDWIIDTKVFPDSVTA